MTNELMYIRLGVSHLPSVRMYENALTQLKERFKTEKITNAGIEEIRFYDDKDQYGVAGYIIVYLPKEKQERKKRKKETIVKNILKQVFSFYTDRLYFYENEETKIHTYSFDLESYMTEKYKEPFNRCVIQNIPGAKNRLLVTIARTLEKQLEYHKKRLYVRVEVDEDYNISFYDKYPIKHLEDMKTRLLKATDFRYFNRAVKHLKGNERLLKEGDYDRFLNKVIAREIGKYEEMTKERNERTKEVMCVKTNGLTEEEVEMYKKLDAFSRLRIQKEKGKLDIQVVYPYNVSPADNIDIIFQEHAFDLVEKITAYALEKQMIQSKKFSIEDNWVKNTYDTSHSNVPKVTYKETE